MSVPKLSTSKQTNKFWFYHVYREISVFIRLEFRDGALLKNATPSFPFFLNRFQGTNPACCTYTGLTPFFRKGRSLYVRFGANHSGSEKNCPISRREKPGIPLTADGGHISSGCAAIRSCRRSHRCQASFDPAFAGSPGPSAFGAAGRQLWKMIWRRSWEPFSAIRN